MLRLCQDCGKEFQINDTNKKKRFCSRICSARYRWRNHPDLIKPRKLPSDEVLIELYSKQLLSTREIGKKFGCSGNAVWEHLRNNGIKKPIREIIYKRGYPASYAPEHPRAMGDYVLTHTLVMEKKLNRFLTSNDQVHHIDLDKRNCLEDNLWLGDIKTHNKAHQSLMPVASKLIKKGIIKFNIEKGQYFLDENKV